MPRRESAREVNKDTASKDDTSEIQTKENKDRKERKVEKDKNEKGEKQVKIDKMMTQLQKDSRDEKEPSIQDLITVVTSLDKKFSQLASKDYIENALDKRLQNLVSEDSFNTKLDSLKTDISHEIKLEMDKVYENLRTVKGQLKASDAEIEQLKNAESDRKVELDKVREENVALIRKNKELKEKIMENHDRTKFNNIQINELEQYSRRNSIRMYGVEDTDKDETPTVTAGKIIKVLKNKLDIEIDVSKIDIAHRLGKFSEEGNRPIICKLLNRTDKMKIIGARKGLKGTSIVIREDLTLKNARLLEKLSSKDEVSNCWSDGGKIIALLSNGKKVKIDLFTDLSKNLLH